MKHPKLTPKRTANGKYWQVNIPASIAADGVRERRFFSTKIEAETFSEVHRIRLLNFGRGSSALSASQMEQAVAAFERLPEGVTLAQVIGDWLRVNDATSKSVTLAVAWEDYVKAKSGSSPVYLKNLRRCLSRLSSLAAKVVAHITPADIEAAFGGVPPSSRQILGKMLNAVLNHGIKRDWLTINPMAKVDRIPVPKGETITLAPAQATALMQAAERRPDFIAYHAIAMFAGVRPYELERLTWGEVDLVEGHITITAAQSKTNRRRIVPIEPNLKAWLERAVSLGVKASGPIVSQKNLRGRLNELRKEAGLADWVQDVMRHSYASHWLAQNEDINRLTLALGHTSPTMLWKHYHRATKRTDAALYWAILPSETPTNIVAISAA